MERNDIEQTTSTPAGADADVVCTESCAFGILSADSGTCSRTAIKDVAREMAKRIYRGIRFGQAYVDEGEQAYLERTRERTIKSMKKKILKLGISAKELGIFAA